MGNAAGGGGNATGGNVAGGQCCWGVMLLQWVELVLQVWFYFGVYMMLLIVKL